MNNRRPPRSCLLAGIAASLLISACAPVLVCRDSSQPLAGFPVPAYEELISIDESPDSGLEIGNVRVPSSKLRCAIQSGKVSRTGTDLVRKITGNGLLELQNGVTFHGPGPAIEGVPNNCLSLTDGKIQPGYYRPMGRKICPVVLASSLDIGEKPQPLPELPGKDIRSEINIYRESSSPDFAQLAKLIESLADKLGTEQGRPPTVVNFGSRGPASESNEPGPRTNEVLVKFETARLAADPLKVDLSQAPVATGPLLALPKVKTISFDHAEVELGSTDEGATCAKRLEIYFDGSSGIESVEICSHEPAASPVSFLNVKTSTPRVCSVRLSPELASSSSRALSVVPNKKEIDVNIPGKAPITIQLAMICG